MIDGVDIDGAGDPAGLSRYFPDGGCSRDRHAGKRWPKGIAENCPSDDGSIVRVLIPGLG